MVSIAKDTAENCLRVPGRRATLLTLLLATLIAPHLKAQTLTYTVGTAPSAIVFDGTNIWAANSGDDTVTKLLASTGATVGTYFAGGNPLALAFDGVNIWIANPNSPGNPGVVTKLLASTGGLIGQYVVSGGAEGLVFDGFHIWVTGTATGVTGLTASTGAVVGTYPVGSEPIGIAFDGTNIWVADSGSGGVTKLSAFGTSPGTYLGFYLTDQSPSELVFDGSNMWVSNLGSNNVTKLSESGSILGTYSVGSSPGGLAYDGKNIWVANAGSNTVTELLASTGATIRNYGVGSAPFGVAFDGTNIWVTNFGSNTVTKIPVTSQQYSQTITFGPLSAITYPSLPIALTATSTSGLPVTFTSATPAVCSVSGATVTINASGTCSITASQAGNATYAAATPVTQSFTVLPQSIQLLLTTILTSSVNPSVLGQQITLTATISGPIPHAGPISFTGTGSVTFYDGTAVIGTATVSDGFVQSPPIVVQVGIATVAISQLTQGVHSLSASYSGDTNYAPSTSPTLVQTVLLPQSAKAVYTYTGVTFYNSSGCITSTDHINISLTYSSVLPANSTFTGFGQSTFPQLLSWTMSDGCSALSASDGISALGIALLTTNAAGNIVNWQIQGTSPGVQMVSELINFSGFEESTTHKDINGNNIGEGLSSAPGLWTNVITQLSASTTSLTSSVNSSVFGQSVTLTATVTPSTAAGTITFEDGGTSLSAVPLTRGTASLTLSTLAVGTHSLTAVYSGDANDENSTSSVLTQVVNQATTSISLSSSPNPSLFGQTLTLTATVIPSNAIGTVTFKDGVTLLGTAMLSSGTATPVLSTLAVGSHSLTAVYNGNTNYSASTSNVVTQVVNPAVLTITTSTLPGGPVGTLYSQSLAATGGTPPYSNWVLNSGMLPPGLTLNASMGVISGNPTTSVGSPFSFTVIVKDSTGTTSAPQSVSISISQPSGLTIITASPLPPGTVGVPYTQAFDATGGATPYRNWTVTAGTIPPETSLTTINSFLAGLLTGTPTTGGTYTFSVQVTDSVAATATKQFSLTINSPGTISTSPNGIVNAASYAGGGVAPGEIVAIFGSGIGPNTLASLQVNPNGTLATTLSGVQVLFDGNPAPLIYVSSTQVSAVVPYEVSGETSTQIQVIYQGQKSSVVTVPVTTAEPGIFSLDGSGSGAGAILNQDGSVNSSTNPASSGSIIVLYATGEGQTNPSGVDGELDGSPAPKPLQPVTATVGGLPATIIYAGGVSGLVSGVLQVNIQLPQGVTPANAVPVTLNIGGANSQTGVTVAVK